MRIDNRPGRVRGAVFGRPRVLRRRAQGVLRAQDTLVEGLKKIPGVVYSEPKGAFYVMAALPVDDAEKFQIWMLEEFDDNGDTLMFTPAESFYKTPHTGVNEIRMAYVINEKDITRCMELLKKGIEAYSEAN